MNLGLAVVEDDALMFQGNQIGDIFANELTLYVSIESVVNNELSLQETQALADALPAIRLAITSSSFIAGQPDRYYPEVDQIPNLVHVYKKMWKEVYG